MKKLWEQGSKRILAVVAGIIIFLGFAMLDTYHANRQMIIQQQQQHLLLITRAVSQNLELHISQQSRQVSILTQTPGFVDAMEKHYQTEETEKIKEYIFSYLLSDQNGPSRMYLLNNKGEQIFHFNRYPFLEEFDETMLQLDISACESKAGIGVVFPISKHRYGMTLVNSVYGGGRYLGTVVSVLDLEALYSRYVVPLQTENGGYITVKDEQGTTIMHPNTRMLGFNYWQDIRDFDNLKQYDGQRAMLTEQYTREVGVAICNVYANEIVPPEKEVSAFSRMNLWGTSWYISAAMPYYQVMAIEFDSLRKFGLLFSAVLLVVIATTTIIYYLMKNRQKLRLQTQYLQQINATLGELHQSREEARHYQKLTTIGTLVGGIAHEFNNLLTPILGYAEFLKEQLGKENEFYLDIDEIYKAGIRAKEIVEQVLPFSRKESDTTGYRPVNIDTVIRDAVKMISFIIPSNITIKECLDDSNANIYGSATQLHQVLLNLLSNAVHSMEETGGILKVATCRLQTELLPEDYPESAGTEYVEVTVEDTGCGMDEEILRQIFNPFFTTKGVGKGTGLGLPVVQDILTNHSGFIRVESVPDKGSRFSIYLPVSVENVIFRPVTAEVKREPEEKTSLLLVDDEERVVRYLAKRLERKGYHVDAYTDPKLALKALEQTPKRWHVAVVDYMMPEMKGTVLAQRMKIRQPELRILLITGLVESEALRVKQSGVIDNIINKPVDFYELIREIKTAEKAAREY